MTEKVPPINVSFIESRMTGMNNYHRFKMSLLHGERQVALMPVRIHNGKIHMVASDAGADLTVEYSISSISDIRHTVSDVDGWDGGVWVPVTLSSGVGTIDVPVTAIRIANGHGSQSRSVEVIVG